MDNWFGFLLGFSILVLVCTIAENIPDLIRLKAGGCQPSITIESNKK